ncbi:TPA: tyrosine-type recombinase/integrase [Clostridium botulinum]|uniref:tyrosine-type recombinase/integrase n=2 Tax=Clostridium botulinum TaxID=1491 RepID=UPI00035BA189|nr:site-specific integrase [Clostridium botulinum]EPS55255.1 integrase family protein [Clostridium botulinum Af84]MBN3349012.1 site-specific integrase [Clostridium botulinum]MBN3356580.1 site-specific integrase [Clostridium botulinum]NFM81096.1 site-specific integrase [Clostridium botulinum]NFP10942.1 site-specific integrase [Clostridium botulinum]
MKGGVRKRGATWSYYFYIGEVDGKKKMKEKGGFKSKPECEKALMNALYEFENGGYLTPKKITLIQFSLEWLEEYVKPLRKITTYNRYKELIQKYISKTIGTINITDIQSFHIEQLLLNIKKENKISGATLQSIYTILNTIMNRALKLKIIKDNPCKYVERPKRDKFIPDVLEIEEIEKLLNALDLEDRYDYMFNIALKITLELGLRRGELGGLEWKDVNFKENILSVKNNLIYTNGHVKMTTPKTLESCRNIYISEKLVELFKNLKTKQDVDKEKYRDFYEKNVFNNIEYDFVMRWDNGKYIHPMYYTNKLTKVIKKAKIDKKVRFHDLRHTNATLLLSQGVDFKVIQERLGHEDINTTLNTYSHVNKSMQKNATDKLNSILDF